MFNILIHPDCGTENTFSKFAESRKLGVAADTKLQEKVAHRSYGVLIHRDVQNLIECDPGQTAAANLTLSSGLEQGNLQKLFPNSNILRYLGTVRSKLSFFLNSFITFRLQHRSSIISTIMLQNRLAVYHPHFNNTEWLQQFLCTKVLIFPQ